jgi:plasmid stability protein
MSKTLQIRDVPEDVHATIRSRAALAGQSISEYLLAQVTGLARHPTQAEVAERIRTMARQSPGPSDDDILAALHEGRREFAE